MIKKQILLFIFIIVGNVFSQQHPITINKDLRGNILIFTAVEYENKSHDVTTIAADTIAQFGMRENFDVKISNDPHIFSETSLRQYSVIIFLNTRGNVLNESQQLAFQKYVRGGGSTVVIHAAMLAEEDWEWFRELVGTQFLDHPKIQPGKIQNAATNHEINKDLPKEWIQTDEWYNYIDIPENVTVLLRVDETSYTGGKHAENHPISWCHQYDGGFVFYTALGHTDENWSNQLFLKHVFNGINYAVRISKQNAERN